MKKENFNTRKEQYRGTIKQIMKVRGLRTINLSNYSAWSGADVDNVHSIKLDIQDGYLNLFCTPRDRINDARVETYEKIFNVVMDIFANEHDIPRKICRNILVKLSR